MLSKECLAKIELFAAAEAKNYYALIKSEYFMLQADKKPSLSDKMIARQRRVEHELKLIEEAQKDLAFCMMEFCERLVESGKEESIAFDEAKEHFKLKSEYAESKVIYDKISNDFNREEKRKTLILHVIFFYALPILSALAIGITTGILLAHFVFPKYYGECVAVCIICGILLGTSIGLFTHAVLINKDKYK